MMMQGCKLRPSSDQQRRGALKRHSRRRSDVRVGRRGCGCLCENPADSPKRLVQSPNHVLCTSMHMHSGYRRGIMEKGRQRRRSR
jgi:hypothetical protein